MSATSNNWVDFGGDAGPMWIQECLKPGNAELYLRYLSGL